MYAYQNISGDLIAGLVEGLGKTAVSAIDTTKQRQFSQAIAAMGASQQKELNQQLVRAQTQSQKLQIVLDTIGKYEAEQQRQKALTRNILIIGGIVIVVSGILFMALRKKLWQQ